MKLREFLFQWSSKAVWFPIEALMEEIKPVLSEKIEFWKGKESNKIPFSFATYGPSRRGRLNRMENFLIDSLFAKVSCLIVTLTEEIKPVVPEKKIKCQNISIAIALLEIPDYQDCDTAQNHRLLLRYSCRSTRIFIKTYMKEPRLGFSQKKESQHKGNQWKFRFLVFPQSEDQRTTCSNSNFLAGKFPVTTERLGF